MKLRGYTLIEVIVSLAIIGIMAVSILSALDASLLNIVRAGYRTAAVENAEIELIDKVTYEDSSFNFSLTLGTNSTPTIAISEVKVIKLTGTAYIGNDGANSVDIITYKR